MCRFIVCIVYFHRYTSFLTEAVSTKAGSSRKPDIDPTVDFVFPVNKIDCKNSEKVVS
jgi:hypothetical protein